MAGPSVRIRVAKPSGYNTGAGSPSELPTTWLHRLEGIEIENAAMPAA
jgi:hypothetical protein